MICAMTRMIALALVVAAAGCSGCSKSAASQDNASATAPGTPPSKIVVPGGDETPTPVDKAAPVADDPKFHLKPDEGTISIDAPSAKAGAEATAAIKLTPGTGYHISQDFPIKLTLDAPAGVKLAKAELLAGKGEKGDADTFNEKLLAFAVKATADKPGSYEIKGVFKFGVCDDQSCHPKKQPITIALAAN